MTAKLRDWITSYPGFAGREFTEDMLLSGADAAGIFFKGEQVISRRTDILGGIYCRRRVNLSLLLRSREKRQMSQCLADFVRWAERTAPVLGQQQTVRAEQAKLRHAAGTGITTYEIQVALEFTEITR